MSELSDVLDRLGLSQYLTSLLEEGFETWNTVLDITESDLSFLEFKLGHRRRLQREIAKQRGLADLDPLPLNYQQSFSEEPPDDLEDKSSPKSYGKGQPQGKRKYKRHPKIDENAPERPPSAYVMFANHTREELKGRGLSFSEMAKHVGEKWKVLNPEIREEYEFHALSTKEKYNQEMAEYKKTDSFREYVAYLNDFKARTSKESTSVSMDMVTPANDASRKRPKLESLPNSAPASLQNSNPSSNTTATTSSLGTLSTGVIPISTIRRHAGSVSSTESGPTSAGIKPTSTYSSPGSSTSTPAMYSAQPHTLPQHYHTQTSPPVIHTPRAQSLANQPPPPPSPATQLGSVATYSDAMVQQTEQQQLEVFKAPGAGYSDYVSEALTLSRMHGQQPLPMHIQPNLSFSRGQPSPGGSPSQYSRRGGQPSYSKNPILNRSDTVSSQGSKSSTESPSVASVTSVTPLTSADRDPMEVRQSSGYSRALPLPTLTQGVAPSGYFEQRPQVRTLAPLAPLGPGNASSPSKTQLPSFDRSRLGAQQEDPRSDQNP